MTKARQLFIVLQFCSILTTSAQIILGSVILLNNICANDAANKAAIKQQADEMKNSLVRLRDKLSAGSGWEKWKGFYKPENFRIHTPPPSIEIIDKIITAL